MITDATSELCQLADCDLLASVRRAALDERSATRHLIALLSELDARRLYLGEGFSSLFTYCTQALQLSEHATYNRIEAARAARRFPVIFELLEAGSVTLTTVRLVAPHLTEANHRALLERLHHKSKRDVELVIATLTPAPDVRSVVRKLRAPLPARIPEVSDAANSTVVEVSMLRQNTMPAATPSRPAEVKPLAPERYKIQVTVSREAHDKLRRAQDLLRHVVPNGDPAIILERALDLLVADLERTGCVRRLDHNPCANRSAQRGMFRLQSNAKYGIATAGSVRSREHKGGVPKRASWNSLTSCRMQRAAQRPRAILNCGVEVTTSTRRSGGLVLAGRPR
jgi:hypothetical protein